MQHGVTQSTQNHLLHEYQNCSSVKTPYIFLSFHFEQQDANNYDHLLFY